MSSMVSNLVIAALFFTPAAAFAADSSDAQGQWTVGGTSPFNDTLSDPTRGNAQLALQRWRILSQSDNYSFDDYAGFLVSYPGWPEDTRMRRNAERVLDLNTVSAGRVLAYFEKLEPLSNAGAGKYALALANQGQMDKARNWAVKAWRGGTLPEADEQALLSRFTGVFSASDHDARMDALLWARATVPAARQLGWTSPNARTVFAARLAQLTNAADADVKASEVAALARTDPGFLADRARYLRVRGDAYGARNLMASRPALDRQPANPETWYESMLILARESANDSQWSLAYNIASKVDDAYVPGTDISQQSSGVRDKYTDLTWLAGNAALYNLGRPQDAIVMFDRYGNAAQGPHVRSKGFYWAGRAAEAAGKREEATIFFEKAAAYPAYFYGQLAHERLGRALPHFKTTADASIPEEKRASFYAEPLTQATRIIAREAGWRDQIRFYRALAFNAKGEADYALLADLSRQTGRRDLGVIAALSAHREGYLDYDPTAFPTMAVPYGHESNWTMIHAITRQESQFAEGAISHAGARGLMQLMPGTAREQSGKLGLSYNMAALTDDQQYNIQLGSGYFMRMLDYYGGSYPLAVAAYNAGPGNVNKWLRANGDPRMGGIDWLRWIEQIPIYETKNYVQRVLENAVVYDSMNPRGPTFRSDTPLSRFIGKNSKG